MKSGGNTGQLLKLGAFLDGISSRYAAGTALLALTNACALLMPWLMKLAVDGLQHPAEARFSSGTVAAIMAVVSVAYGIIRIFSRTVILHAARLLEFRLSEALFSRILVLDSGFCPRERTGDILSRFTNDLANVRMLTGFGVMGVINTALIYAAALWLMVRIDLWLTVIAVMPLPLMVIAVRSISARLFEVSRQAQEELAGVSALAEESISSARLIKSYCREEQFDQSFAKVSQRCLLKNLELARLRGMAMPIMSAAIGAGTLAVLFFGGRHVIYGQITLGEFVAFSGYLALLAWPTAMMGWILGMIQRGAASMGRLNELLEAVPKVVQCDDAVCLATIGSGIVADRLVFSYGERQVLKGVSFSVKRGERLGITGSVGSGKSTLLRLLIRLLPADSNMLYIDGVDINKLDITALRQMAGYVPQEGFLFSGSIGDNIGYGGSGDTGRAAAMAGLTSDLAAFRDGLDTVTGERGVTLSGGQRQRVSLARALVREPELLLLDDPLAAVDAGREDEILAALAESWQNRTVIIVSQRLSAFRDCHRVLVLDNGMVAEQGTTDELLAANGFYAELARLQGQADRS